MKRHALRLNHTLRLSLWRLHEAGPEGLPLDLLADSCLLEAWGLGEFFTDESRILRSRIRITVSGERIAVTLIQRRAS